MTVVQALVLGVVQGITEFFPVSSSGHLILVPKLFGWETQSLAFDAFIHLATLLAILIALRHDVVATLKSRTLTLSILIATVPVLVVGFFAGDIIATSLRNPGVVAVSLVLWAIVLWIVDRRVKPRAPDELSTMTFKKTLWIGCAQVLALIPGTSRSGITAIAGMQTGLSRAAAIRFGFLLGVPAIALAGAYGFFELLTSGQSVEWMPIFVGFFTALIVGILSISFLLRLLVRTSFFGFVVYRFVLAAIVIMVYLS